MCLHEYTSHWHCDMLHADVTIDTAPSVARIASIVVNYAVAGVHCVAPSNMMDGRILKMIKCALMSYVAKFTSSLYGPFRCTPFLALN